MEKASTAGHNKITFISLTDQVGKNRWAFQKADQEYTTWGTGSHLTGSSMR